MVAELKKKGKGKKGKKRNKSPSSSSSSSPASSPPSSDSSELTARYDLPASARASGGRRGARGRRGGRRHARRPPSRRRYDPYEYSYYSDDADNIYRHGYIRRQSSGRRRRAPPRYGYSWRSPVVILSAIFVFAGVLVAAFSAWQPNVTYGVVYGVCGVSAIVAGVVMFVGARWVHPGWLKAGIVTNVVVCVIATISLVVMLVAIFSRDDCKPIQDDRYVHGFDEGEVERGEVSEGECRRNAVVVHVVAWLWIVISLGMAATAARSLIKQISADATGVGGGQIARAGDSRLTERFVVVDPLDETCQSVESSDGNSVVDDRSVLDGTSDSDSASDDDDDDDSDSASDYDS